MNIYSVLKKITVLACTAILPLTVYSKEYSVFSPDNRIKVVVETGDVLKYSISFNGKVLMSPSEIGMRLPEGELLGNSDKLSASERNGIVEHIEAPFYRSSDITVKYNELSLASKKRGGVTFRVYNEGVAYRFHSDINKDIYVKDETAEFNFPQDYVSYVPYTTNKNNHFCMAFQNTYTVAPVSEFDTELPAFLPVTLCAGDGVKLTLLESDLKSYPGMFLARGGRNNSVKGVFAKYPTATAVHHTRCMEVVTERGGDIAETMGKRTFPWRIIAVTDDDRQMPVNPLVYALGEPSRVKDTSWIKPGKIAWEWWNNWGIHGVGFKVGINNETYKHYIDFASDYGLEYVVLDEGWSEPAKGDLLTSIPEIDLPELIAYAKSKNVDLVLWAVGAVLDKQLEEACRKYSEMGIAGFKVDFFDRDDQKAVEMIYRISEGTAKYRLVLDLHGIYKPTGLNRTYPHILNFEGVYGLEELKWSNPDMPLYDVTMPFIRMMSGPADYTQGAMTNANKKNFRPVYDSPMSQGTRCHQMAAYVVFDSPMVTLCDNPTVYRKEHECVEFISAIPVDPDKTVIVSGKLGEHIVTARRFGDEWYVGGLTNWDLREIEVCLDFLEPGQYNAEIFRDGVNAARKGEDYIKEIMLVDNSSRLNMLMREGGGFVIKLKRN